ncbi:OLC1v1035548C1 [Oldenlandia corymbosa var. corymbosa]|uniref:OLC1v1035548C1 n=1 Tax=Oldenlandia corymbosa var. corymbosa TaxID=529605 RepID=A0AAV1CUF3_OLDCO|nr:OLC1v1035548C1 [Oldenlandia corymbosa var. corymbosa]
MADHFPQHLIANVLLRLPFNSLLRFRCVSKSWRDLIVSPYFTKLHSKTSHIETRIISVKGSTFYSLDSVPAIAKQLNSPALEFPAREYQLAGSCNGIICLWNSEADDLVLWNPWIDKFSALPFPPYEFPSSYRGCCLGTGFGYDYIDDDYKVVKWHTFSDFSDHLNNLPSSDRYELCVYSLKQNSWKRIKDAIPFQMPDEFNFFFPHESMIVLLLMVHCTGLYPIIRNTPTSSSWALILEARNFGRFPTIQAK